jgi:hypothetical protein
MRHSGSITRRSLLGAGALGLLSLEPGARLAAQLSVARGKVLQADRNGPKGVPGILVSNGVEVTRTDAEGAYSLPFRDGLFVIKPAHWRIPHDVRTGHPAFACMRPQLPGSARPDPVDFFIERSPEPKSFRAAVLADPQPANIDEVGFLQRAMDKMCTQDDFAFALALGDIASDNLSIYPAYREQAGRLGVPVWHIPGNHDHDAHASGPRGLDTWRATFGPPTYAFEYSGALFVMLDNVMVTPAGYRGEIGPAGLTFVRNLLAHTPQEKLIVVCTHIPLASSHADDPSCTTSDTSALLRLLDGRKAVSFSGHMHTSEHHYLPYPGGTHHHQIITALSGSWWSGPFDPNGQPLSVSSDGTPHGWHELSIDGADYHTTFVPARDDAVVRAIVPGSANGAAATATIETVSLLSVEGGLLVNVFDGGPRTRVFVEAGGERHLLQRVHAADPYTEQLYREAGASLKYWVQAEVSTHLWTLDLSALPASMLRDARLTIIDEFGRTGIDNAPVLLS